MDVVEVELLLLSSERQEPGVVRYRIRRGAGGPGETPDQVASRLARAVGACEIEVLHSTSWRHQQGTVVLTYAGLPDARDLGTRSELPDADQEALPLYEPAVLCSGDPRLPGPPAIHAHHVVAHAVRHLAHLAEHDSAVSDAACRSTVPQLWSAIRRAAAGMPTGTHSRAHQAASRSAQRAVGSGAGGR